MVAIYVCEPLAAVRTVLQVMRCAFGLEASANRNVQTEPHVMVSHQ